MNMTASEKEAFAKSNFGLVHSCANKFRGRGIEYDDLFSTGCVGLIKAIDAFDEHRGVKFSTYAVPVILGEIKRIFRDGGAVKVSRGIKELSMKIARQTSDFSNKYGREPTVSELAEILEVTPEEIAEAISAAMPTVSLTPTDDEYEGRQIDVATESVDDNLTDRIVLKTAVQKLEPEDRKLIVMRYFKYKTQSQTAEIMNMTQVQVSRREKKILTKLRAMLC